MLIASARIVRTTGMRLWTLKKVRPKGRRSER